MIIIKKLYILIAALVLLVGCGSNNAKEYKISLNDVADQMIEETEKAEMMLSHYSSIWKFSIENRSPIPVNEMAAFVGLDESEVKEYFEINGAGNVSNDFSSNVHSVMLYFDDVITERKEHAKDIKDKVSELNDPPKGYDKAYDEILNMYDLYEKHNEALFNPSGSLQEFNSNKNELFGEITSKHKRIEVVMPSK